MVPGSQTVCIHQGLPHLTSANKLKIYERHLVHIGVVPSSLTFSRGCFLLNIIYTPFDTFPSTRAPCISCRSASFKNNNEPSSRSQSSHTIYIFHFHSSLPVSKQIHGCLQTREDICPLEHWVVVKKKKTQMCDTRDEVEIWNQVFNKKKDCRAQRMCTCSIYTNEWIKPFLWPSPPQQVTS